MPGRESKAKQAAQSASRKSHAIFSTLPALLKSRIARFIGSEVNINSGKISCLRFTLAEFWLEITSSPSYKTVTGRRSYCLNARGGEMVPNRRSHL
jgi:hypothetical protein